MSGEGCVPYTPDYEKFRPGITTIAEEISVRHPEWDADLVIARAKEEWHRRMAATRAKAGAL